ncbi:GNAT family N-acetyltransferase [Nonomuraea sp. KC401]|uniref:GNAT family N-acetyltransferase n=1 Tax=unclassified Nonomuraea TaxID=2593643 RepID=UPI0010FE1F4F|nr:MULTISPECIES: GNAT family protein [unclassified Nonomuraea]NBE92952.1 GNAT family N-acetyltransferase [Nonomuraea sp. K271]TLF83319.1 GNAT family N-acetyltransferase [Nonomuraea sp. KC401]
MSIEFTPYSSGDVDALADFLTGSHWPFHAGTQDAETVRQRAGSGLYWNDESRTFWVLADGERAGLVRLQDLADDTPMFDLRIRADRRGKGLGTAAVAWLTSYLFTEFPHVTRIEATTRQDNHAMRAALRRSGYAKEAHYREAWPAPDGGTPHDSVGYAVLRHDWISGTVTLPDWHDEPATRSS